MCSKTNLQGRMNKNVKVFLRYGIPCMVICIIVISTTEISGKDERRTQYTSKWLTESAVRSKTDVRGMICTLLKDEAVYIQEWITFHLLMGVDVFIIYDDNSTDNLLEKLRLFQNKVIILPWASVDKGRDNQEHIQSDRQISAARHCVAQFGHVPEWLIFLDVDEFMFPCAGKSNDLRPWIQDASVKLECLKYGTGSIDRPALPDELTIEKHTLRAPYEKIDRNTAEIRKRFSSCKRDPRLCETEGSWKYAYNTRKYPENRKLLAQTLRMHGSHAIPTASKPLTRDEGICCNHYGFRSTALAIHKAKKNRNTVLAMTVMNNESMALYNSILDEKILRYVALVRGDLARTRDAFRRPSESE